MRASHTAEVVLDGCHVPRENRLSMGRRAALGAAVGAAAGQATRCWGPPRR